MRHQAICLPMTIAALWLLPGAAAGDTVKAACSAPAPGHAACLALRLVPSASAAAKAAPYLTPGGEATPAGNPAPEPPGLSPEQLHRAYELPAQAGEAQTIAIVDAYDDPNAEADLEVFDQQYSLPACTQANGCFTKLNQQGLTAPMPKANGGWSIEIATDIEVAHSVCENCRIVLVEATSDTFSNLERAEDTAAGAIGAASGGGAPAGEISNSWGGQEPPGESSAFTHPGIVITASSGDSGYLNWQDYAKQGEPESPYFDGPSYPASSPRVVAVGGTSLTINEATGEWAAEKVWNRTPSDGAGGGGCSSDFTAPPWQPLQASWPTVGCGTKRAVADISADADPKTGVHAYDSVVEGLGTEEEATNHEVPEWITIGGTSVASPIVASAFALGGGAHGIEYPAATLYAHAGTGALHDIVTGGNGECDDQYTICGGSLGSPLDCGAGNTICNAAPGYDGPTGVGTPIGLGAFQPVPGEVGGPGGAAGGGGSGGGSATASPGAGTASPPPAPKAPAAVQPRILRLSLTTAAMVALNRSHPALAKIAFSFVLSAAANVRVTLARWTRVHGHGRWASLRGSNTLAAHAGFNRAHLRGRGALPAGRYRLTLTPAHGIASSLTISIG